MKSPNCPLAGTEDVRMVDVLASIPGQPIDLGQLFPDVAHGRFGRLLALDALNSPLPTCPIKEGDHDGISIRSVDLDRAAKYAFLLKATLEAQPSCRV
jgi:hypothetical protein